MPGSRFHPYSPNKGAEMNLQQGLVSPTASTSHQAISQSSTNEESLADSHSYTNEECSPSLSSFPNGCTPTLVGSPWSLAHAESTLPLSETVGFDSAAHLIRDHKQMEQQWDLKHQQWQQHLWIEQPNLHWRQQLWTQQPNLAGNNQEYIRYMNELRLMSSLPLLPTSPIPLPYQSPMQDHPLNLSLKDSFQDSAQSGYDLSSNRSRADSSQNSIKSEEPIPERSAALSVTIYPTKPVEAGSLDPEVARLFPHLRTTDMGSIVLWNFLWALLADQNYQGIIKWIDRPNLKFRVLKPQALVQLWSTVKKNSSMNWGKLMKVINLYLNKNILKQGDDKFVFQFVLIPEST